MRQISRLFFRKAKSKEDKDYCTRVLIIDFLKVILLCHGSAFLSLTSSTLAQSEGRRQNRICAPTPKGAYTCLRRQGSGP